MIQLSLFSKRDQISVIDYHKMDPESRKKLIERYRVVFNEVKDLYSSEPAKKEIARRLKISYQLSSQLKVYIERLEPMSENSRIIRKFGSSSFKKLPPDEQESIKSKISNRLLILLNKGLGMLEAERQISDELNLSLGLVMDLSVSKNHLIAKNSRSYDLKY